MDLSEISQKQQPIIDNNIINLIDKKFPEKKFYQVSTSLGKLTFQVTRFTQYIIVIVCYSGLLKLDGYLQVAYPTPYSANPLVVNLAKDQGQIDSQNLVKKISKQLKCPVFLSLNLDEQVRPKDEEELFQILKSILLPKTQ